MKILITHNSYQQQGGEDAVVTAEIALLEQHGHEVGTYRRHNREVENMHKAATALSSIWSQKSARELGALCDSFQPDLIHSHNTFPLISPSLYWVASHRKIPLVQTLHNFRLLCPQATFLREGKVCEDCLGKVPWRAVTRSCYHQSTLQSAVAAATVAVHRAIGTYRDHVTAFIALSKFSRDKFIKGGLPQERIHIKPNFVGSKEKPAWEGRKAGLYVGRLSPEKGLDVLIGAARILQAIPGSARIGTLKVVGGGPMEECVKEAFGDDYLGAKSPEQVYQLQRKAQYLVAPSTCYETFGLAAIEAFACGVPVIGSRHGGLADIVEDGVNGLLFDPGDAKDLANKIAWAEANPIAMLKMGQAAYIEYLRKYTPEKNYQMLMNIYQQAIELRQGEPHVA